MKFFKKKEMDYEEVKETIIELYDIHVNEVGVPKPASIGLVYEDFTNDLFDKKEKKEQNTENVKKVEGGKRKKGFKKEMEKRITL